MDLAQSRAQRRHIVVCRRRITYNRYAFKMSGSLPNTATLPLPQVQPVVTSRDKRAFVELPYQIYRGDAHWIAPLRMAQKDILNTQKHPFYKTSDVEMFLARRDGRVVGRIMAILNRAHNEFHNERAGFFGFF